MNEHIVVCIAAVARVSNISRHLYPNSCGAAVVQNGFAFFQVDVTVKLGFPDTRLQFGKGCVCKHQLVVRSLWPGGGFGQQFGGHTIRRQYGADDDVGVYDDQKLL